MISSTRATCTDTVEASGGQCLCDSLLFLRRIPYDSVGTPAEKKNSEMDYFSSHKFRDHPICNAHHYPYKIFLLNGR